MVSTLFKNSESFKHLEFRRNAVIPNPSGENRPWRIRIRGREHQGYPPNVSKPPKIVRNRTERDETGRIRQQIAR